MTLTVGAAGGPALDAYLRNGGEDGTVSAAFAHHIDDPLRDPFHWSTAAAAVIRNLLENTAILTSCISLII